MSTEAHGYGKASDLLDLIQVCRRARMQWSEADQFLQEHGHKISRSKFGRKKRFLQNDISNRIQYIAYTEYADMHLQMLDALKSDLSKLEQMSLTGLKPRDLVSIVFAKIKVIETLKQLYNGSTIVSGVAKLVNDLEARVRANEANETS